MFSFTNNLNLHYKAKGYSGQESVYYVHNRHHKGKCHHFHLWGRVFFRRLPCRLFFLLQIFFFTRKKRGGGRRRAPRVPSLDPPLTLPDVFQRCKFSLTQSEILRP